MRFILTTIAVLLTVTAVAHDDVERVCGHNRFHATTTVMPLLACRQGRMAFGLWPKDHCEEHKDEIRYTEVECRDPSKGTPDVHLIKVDGVCNKNDLLEIYLHMSAGPTTVVRIAGRCDNEAGKIRK